MIKESTIRALARQYPFANQVRLPKTNPKEVVFEIFRAPDSSWSIAVALIEASKPHYHSRTFECYKVLKGRLRLFTSWDPQRGTVFGPEGLAIDRFVHIPIGTHHWAQSVGRPAVVLVISSPAWTPEDHKVSKKWQLETERQKGLVF